MGTCGDMVMSEDDSDSPDSERKEPSLRFQPLDPDNAVEVAELRRQRMLCGWGLESVEKWLEMIRKGDRVSQMLIPGSLRFVLNECICCVCLPRHCSSCTGS